MRNKLIALSLVWVIFALATLYLLAVRQQSVAVAVTAWCGGILSLYMLMAAVPACRRPCSKPAVRS